jgi:hypothetical protein
VARNGRVARSLPGGPEITRTIAAGNHAIGGMNTPCRWRIMGLQKRTGKTGSRQRLGCSSLTRTSRGSALAAALRSVEEACWMAVKQIAHPSVNERNAEGGAVSWTSP